MRVNFGAKALVFLTLGLVVAACETKYPDGPPLRDATTEEDRLFLYCAQSGIYQAAAECDRFVSGRER